MNELIYHRGKFWRLHAPFILFMIILLVITLACGSGEVGFPAEPISPTEEAKTSSASDPTGEPVTPTSTSSPANIIHVDTLEQEVYPFIKNGKCSFAEAIFAPFFIEAPSFCDASLSEIEDKN